MQKQELHIASTAPWRALLTHAQVAAGLQLTHEVEEHLVNLLLKYVDNDLAPLALDDNLEESVGRPSFWAQLEVGDQCLLCAGLLPEQVIHKGLPVSHLVRVGRDAYREFSNERGSKLHHVLADEFVRAMDTLQMLRVLQDGDTCIDGLNAFYLWHDLGSVNGWRVLRSLTTALPARCSGPERVH